MNKKKGVLGIIFAFIFLKVIPLVSAYGFGNVFSGIDLRQGWDNVITSSENILSPVFQIILNTNSGEFFFAKCLMLILLFVIIQFIINQSDFFEGRRGIVVLISLIVSVLAMRYMPETDFIKMVLMPYSILGAALLTFLPIAIYCLFVYRSVPGHAARLVAWIVYAAVFASFVAYQWKSVSSVGQKVYLAGLGLVIIFALFDSLIKSWIEMIPLWRGIKNINLMQDARTLSDYKKLLEVYNDNGNPEIRRRLEEMERNMRMRHISVDRGFS